MQCSSTFMRISEPIPEVEKNFIGQWLGKWYWILRRIPAKWGVGKQVSFDPDAVGESGGGTTPRKNLPSFKLGNSISSTWTGTKLLYKYEHFFFLKTAYLII